jgi:hypothetical protein
VATTHKKLSRAKVDSARTALDVLLDGTEHDPRLSPALRERLDRACADLAVVAVIIHRQRKEF